MTAKQPLKVLVFFSYKQHKTGYYDLLFGPMAERAGGFGMEFFQGSLKDLHIYFENDSMRIVDALTGRDIKDFDLVYFELYHKQPQQALAAAKYLDRHQVPYFTPEVGRFVPTSKLGQQATLADQNLPLPDGLTTSNHEFKQLFKKDAPYAYPFVLKSIQAFGGNMNFLIKDYAQLKATLKENPKETFIAQPFIANDFDYRVLILGGEIKLVMKRARISDDTHLNNTSQDGEATIYDASVLTEQQASDSLRAAELVGREQFCGLDLLINKHNNEHVVLEINEAPAIQLGAEPEHKMQLMLEYMQYRASQGGRHD